MHTMKKRLIPCLLAVIMIIAVLPVPAFAAEGKAGDTTILTGDGVEITLSKPIVRTETIATQDGEVTAYVLTGGTTLSWRAGAWADMAYRRSESGYFELSMDYGCVYIASDYTTVTMASGSGSYWLEPEYVWTPCFTITADGVPDYDSQVFFRFTADTYSAPAPAAKTGEKLDSWAKELVDQAIDAGLMPGHLEGTDLTQTITRTQFADLAVTLYEAMSGETVSAPAEDPFSDTNDPAVRKAYAMGFTSGISATEFGADQPLTREAAATMLAAVYKKLGGTVSSGGAAPFADDASISAWAKDSVYFMAQHGIIAGVGENKFDPQAMAQSQAALIIALRMDQNL